MKTADLARGVATVAATSSIDLQTLGFEFGHGRQVTVWMFPRGTAAADPTQAGQIQVSDDDTTFEDATVESGDTLPYDASAGVTAWQIKAQRHMRVNNTAGTAASTDFVIAQES